MRICGDFVSIRHDRSTACHAEGLEFGSHQPLQELAADEVVLSLDRVT
jgi:hypothetical protein